MIPSACEYVVPQTIDEAVTLLAEYGEEARLLAGGHSLIPLMKLRLAAPSVLIDIGRIPDIKGVVRRNGMVAIGASTTYSAIEDSALLQELCPLASEAAVSIGDRQVRNRGTIGGSLAHADPAGDMPAVVLALGGELIAVSRSGERTIAADDCFVDMFTTALKPDEMFTEIHVPVAGPRTGVAYEKFPHPASGYAIVGVAAIVTLGDGDTCRAVRVAITGAGTKATRAQAVEQALIGQEPSASGVARAAEDAAEGLELMGDIHASETYRAHLCRVYAKRALLKAAERARGT
jgi:aerobic carbon-monoxide dehydrogenase medium subunit